MTALLKSELFADAGLRIRIWHFKSVCDEVRLSVVLLWEEIKEKGEKSTVRNS